MTECSRCGRRPKRQPVVFPYRCSCGLQTNADGSTVSLSRRGMGDWIADILSRIGVRKRPGCGCSARQERLNRWSVWAVHRLRAIAWYWHPR